MNDLHRLGGRALTTANVRTVEEQPRACPYQLA